jgi:hypothetical protein
MFTCQECGSTSESGVKPTVVIVARKELNCNTGRAGLDIAKEMKFCNKPKCQRVAERRIAPLDHDKWKEQQRLNMEKRVGRSSRFNNGVHVS